MIEHRNINPNETGLSVRAKLNRMFSDLISGVEGVNKLWKSLIGVNDAVKINNTEIDNLKNELQNRLSDALDYTDREVNDLLSYINGIHGGVNGFADTTEFQPNYPVESAATVIGVGPGTFKNMLDEEGNPITVDSQVVVIFFKASGHTHWKYKTVLPNIVTNEVVSEFGSSESKTISQRFFTDKLKGVVGGAVEFTDLDAYDSFSKSGLYTIKKDGASVGTLFVNGDLNISIVQQFILGGFSVVDGNLVATESSGIVYRTKNISSINSEVDRGSWSPWRMLQDDFMQVVSEDEYEALKASDSLVANRFYFIYEEEQL